MINIIKAEILKNRHSFLGKLVIVSPFISIILSYLLMQPEYMAAEAFNWWYAFILPFTFTLISSSMVVNEKKKNYHGMLSIMINKKKLQYGKVIVGTLYLFISCILFYIIITFGSVFINMNIPNLKVLYASIVLALTFAWQIPFYMIIADKIGLFVTIIISLVCNFIIGVLCATESTWWIPFSIPSRLMCPIIGVLPNGILVEGNSILTNSDVIIPGIIISIGLYFIMFFISGCLFNRKEV